MSWWFLTIRFVFDHYILGTALDYAATLFTDRCLSINSRGGGEGALGKGGGFELVANFLFKCCKAFIDGQKCHKSSLKIC